MSLREQIRPFVCLVLAAMYAFAVIKDMEIYINDTVFKLTGFNGSKSFGWKFKYLTYLDMVIP